MPGNHTRVLGPTPLDITGADFSDISWSVSGGDVVTQLTEDTVAPDPANGGVLFRHGDGKPVSQGLDDIWPGVAAPQRVWAWLYDEGEVAYIHVSWTD